MSLGERICKLRMQKNMSQGELADVLEVSRQSISKWETNGSVPELDKLIKLCDVFGVSLDELVLDKQLPPAETKVVYLDRERSSSPKKTAGIVLLCLAALVWMMSALLGDVISGLVLAAPFVACGVICLLVGRYAGLWCVWVVYLFVDVYLRFASGISWSYVLYPQLYAGGMTVHLTVAWILTAFLGALILATAICTQKMHPGSLRSNIIGAAAAWIVYVLSWFVFAVPFYEGDTSFIHSQAHRYVMAVSGWVRNIILSVAAILLARVITSLFRIRKDK